MAAPALHHRGAAAARHVRGAAAALLTAVAAAGCGGGGAPHPASTTAAGSPSATGATTSAHVLRRRPRRPAGRPIGAAQRVVAGGSTLLVTVTRLLDPLTDSGAALTPGQRAVGVMLTIHNAGPGTYDSTASGDVSVETSAGPGAPLFVRSGVCQTPLTDFESLIGAGQTRSGCVGFSVARGARVRAIRFSPRSRAVGRVTWR